MPAVTVGLQDFAGTGLLSGEYVVATKTLAPGLKATAGLGWGRLGSKGSIGSPFGDRPAIDIGFGGNLNISTWFRGPAAAFGGIEWQATDRLALMAEYSSDAYAEEAGKRDTFRRRSSVNLGAVYEARPGLRLGAYYMYGSTLGLSAQFALDPRSRALGGLAERAPDPVAVRQSAGALGWGTQWVQDAGTQNALLAQMKVALAADGIAIEGLKSEATRSELRIRNTRYDAGAQAVGRAARAMSRNLPSSVEVFDIVLVSDGMPASRVTLRRADLEALEFAPDATDAIRARAVIGAAGPRPDGMQHDPDLYPALAWSVAPYARFRFFDQRDPLKADVGIRGMLQYDFAPGLQLRASVTQKVAGNLKDRPRYRCASVCNLSARRSTGTMPKGRRRSRRWPCTITQGWATMSTAVFRQGIWSGCSAVCRPRCCGNRSTAVSPSGRR